MRVVKITLAYDGTDFHGWQMQPRDPTIQAAVTSAVERVTEERLAIEASGRTDAGVHALGQVASFKTASTIPAANLVKALNRYLPQSVRVLAVEDAPEDFHARFKARSKTYRYRIYRGPVCSPFMWRYVHHFPYPLDEPRMIAAAALFEGTHDFTSLASSEGHSGEGHAGEEKLEKSNVRTIFSSSLTREAEELVYQVRGNGFLHHMVRNIVGTLVEVGKGRMSVTAVPDLLAARRRSAAGPTLPAKGLCLVEVNYEQ